MEKYRFINGSLYKYDKGSNSYIHCYKNAYCKTKKSAVKAYEEQLFNYAEGEEDSTCL